MEGLEALDLQGGEVRSIVAKFGGVGVPGVKVPDLPLHSPRALPFGLVS